MNYVEQDEIKRQLQILAHKYCLTEQGKWLTDFEWVKIPVEFEELRGDVCGKYAFGKIILKDCHDAKLIFSVYIHELRHRWQWIQNPVKYVIGKVFRPLIEKDAYAQQDLADEWVVNVKDA